MEGIDSMANLGGSHGNAPGRPDFGFSQVRTYQQMKDDGAGTKYRWWQGAIHTSFTLIRYEHTGSGALWIRVQLTDGAEVVIATHEIGLDPDPAGVWNQENWIELLPPTGASFQ